MDELIHKILVILVFFMTISQVEKIKAPSIIHKQAQKLNKREKNEEKWNEKKKDVESLI